MTVVEAVAYLPLMRKTALRRLRNWHDAEDVAQDVFVRLLKRPDPRRGAGALRHMAACRASDVYWSRELRRGRAGRPSTYGRYPSNRRAK